MTIPYLQRVGAGLSIDEDIVCYVELVSTLGRRLRLRRIEREPVHTESVEAALQRLALRLGARPRFVHTHVPSGAVHLRTLEVPAYEDPEDIDRWLADHTEQFQAEVLAGRPGTLRATLLAPDGDTDDATRPRTALLCAVDKVDLDHRIRRVHQAGFEPIRIGMGSLEAVSALVVGRKPVLEGSVLVVGAQRSIDVTLWEGQPQSIQALDVPPSHVVDERMCSSEASYKEAGYRDSVALVVTGAQSEAAVRARRKVGHTVSLGIPLTRQCAELDPEDAVAVGLAVEALYPGLAAIDFVDDRLRQDGLEAQAKQEAQRAILTLGMILLAVLVVTQAAVWYHTSRLERSEPELLEQAAERMEAEQLREEVAQLRRDVAAAQDAAAERTEAASLLEVVGRALPPGVWLVEYSWDGGTGTAAITAYAQSMAGVEAYLFALERLEFSHQVDLLYSERVAPEVVERATGERRALIRLGIQLVTPP